jgi:hypothetical protein
MRWFGKRGMHWKELNDTVARALDRFPPPAYMIIHCGSNDLTEVKTADLIHDISADIIRFKLLLPNTKIVWSDILMRRYWHKARDGRAVERSRNRVNLAVKNAVLKEGFCVIRHPNIRSTEINLYRHDGTHLSDTGNAVYLNNVQGAIEYYLVSDSRTLFPPQ